MVVTTDMVLVVVAAAFLPPVIYLMFVRNVERIDREPWGRVFAVFFYGALVSVLIALGLEAAFHTDYQREYEIKGFALTDALLLVVVVAPLVEEFSKGLAVRIARRHINELEDGIIYGAAAGLGFSATENIIYELHALQTDGTTAFLWLALVRSITACFLHATATGLVGYGLARHYVERHALIVVVPFYALAVLLHAVFNLIASFLFPGALLLILLISYGSIRWTVRRIRQLDQSSVPAFHPLR